MRVVKSGNRTLVETDAPWEAVVGYSRAVRQGPFIAVTSTVGRNPDGTYPESAHEQAHRALEIVVRAIEALGGTARDVIRTRLYVVDMRDWEEVGRAHAEVFGHVLPATTLVEVSRLIDVRARVEVEADAIVS